MTELLNDIDWNGAEPVAAAAFRLNQAFVADPMMRLFDTDALLRLSWYVAEQIKVQIDENPEWRVTMWNLPHMIESEIIAFSPYGAFGRPFASKVATLAQQALYPKSYTEATA